MVSIGKQIYMLQWKNIKLKQRRPVSTLLELLGPVLLIVILIGIRQSQDFLQKSPTCNFKPSALASKGIVAALRSFCHLGVCQQGNQSFHAEQNLLTDEENRNISRTLSLVNSWLGNPSMKKLAGAVMSLQANSSDPTPMKRIRLSSLFKDRATKLFDGVGATDAQKTVFKNAEIPFPKRLDMSVSPSQRVALASLLVSDNGVPALLCAAAIGGDAQDSGRSQEEEKIYRLKGTC